MDCQTAHIQLYLDGVLSASEEDAVLAHILDCSQCQQALDQLQQLDVFLAPQLNSQWFQNAEETAHLEHEIDIDAAWKRWQQNQNIQSTELQEASPQESQAPEELKEPVVLDVPTTPSVAIARDESESKILAWMQAPGQWVSAMMMAMFFVFAQSVWSPPKTTIPAQAPAQTSTLQQKAPTQRPVQRRIAPKQEPQNQTKGIFRGSVQLYHTCQMPSGSWHRCVTNPGERLQEGTLVQFTYELQQASYIMVASIDQHGTISIIVPLDGAQSLRLVERRGTLPKAGSLELDNTLGWERFIVFFSRMPLMRKDVIQALRRSFSKQKKTPSSWIPPEGPWSIRSFWFQKISSQVPKGLHMGQFRPSTIPASLIKMKEPPAPQKPGPKPPISRRKSDIQR